MQNLNNLLKQTGKIVATFVAYDGYRRTINNDNKTTQADKLMKDTIDKYEKITSVLEEKEINIDLNNVKNTAIIGRLQDKLTLLNKDLDNIYTHNQSNGLVKKDIESINESVKSVMEEIKELLLINDSFGTKNNFISSIWDKSRFDSYGALEWGALTHICSSTVILSCLWYIIVAYYGDQLIIYFNLEEKYPKLSKWIRYRKKFQQYYIITNVIVITFLLLAIMYLDITVLINKG